MPNYDLEMAESVIAARDLEIDRLKTRVAELEAHLKHTHQCACSLFWEARPDAEEGTKPFVPEGHEHDWQEMWGAHSGYYCPACGKLSAHPDAEEGT